MKIDTLQIQYSLLSTDPIHSSNLKQLCQELDIQIIAYSPLTLGILTGKYKDINNLPSGPRKGLFKGLLPKIQPLLQTMEAIGKEKGKTMAQVAINWCISQGTIPIPGAKNITQAKENIGALGWRLSDGEVTELETIALGLEKKMMQNIFQTK